MADPITGEPFSPSQIEAAVFERVGFPNAQQQQAQEFAAWRYNQPIGDFGTAYPKSRRKMRMEQEFLQYQKEQLDQQRIMQQLDLQRRAEERLQRDQDLSFENARIEAEKDRIAQDRNKRVLDEAGMMIDSIRGAVDRNGKVIANPIRPEDDDAVERLENLARNFKFGIENKAAAEMFSSIYNDALKFREEKINQSQEQELAAINLSVRTGKPIKNFGTYDERGMFQPRLQGMIAGAEEVKAAEEKKAQGAVVATEKRRAETQADVAEERNILSQEREIQKGIRQATEDLRKMNATFAGRKSISEKERANITAMRDSIVDLEIEKAALRGLAFADQDEYKKAIDSGKKPPVGTTIYIGRNKATVK